MTAVAVTVRAAGSAMVRRIGQQRRCNGGSNNGRRLSKSLGTKDM